MLGLLRRHGIIFSDLLVTGPIQTKGRMTPRCVLERRGEGEVFLSSATAVGRSLPGKYFLTVPTLEQTC